MTAARSGDRESLRTERLLPASPTTVFAWWTTPRLMSAWLSPTGKAEVTADVRVGGRFRLTMIGDGSRIEHNGEYLEVDPPRRLTFTWISDYTGDSPSRVTVELEPADENTRLILMHEQLPAGEVLAHEGGWGSILDNLAHSLRALARTPSHGSS